MDASWLDTFPAELRDRRDSLRVLGWGFGAGPAFAATQEERCAPPLPLSTALEALFARRTVMKVGHIDLTDGGRVWVEPRGFRRIVGT